MRRRHEALQPVKVHGLLILLMHSQCDPPCPLEARDGLQFIVLPRDKDGTSAALSGRSSIAENAVALQGTL